MSVFSLPAHGWMPRKDQRPIWGQIIQPTFRRGVIVAHRRYGKDELGLQATAVKAMSRVGSYWYCLPEYEQARRAIWEMVNWRTRRTRIEDAFPEEIVAKRDDKAMMLWLESGSTVQLIGSDRVDSLVGGGQIGIVLSEAGLSDPRASQFFRPILEESGGWELQISTPRGKNHFYRAYLAAKEDQAIGDDSVFAAYVPATASGVFDDMQLMRIKFDLIREHGAKIGEALFKQEYLCDWYAAVVGAVWGDELSILESEGRAGSFPHDRRYPVHTSWDLGVGDPTVILFWQEINGYYRLIDAYEATDLGVDTYIEVLKAKRDKHRYIYGLHIAPHDVAQREKMRGISVKDAARRLGLEFKQMPTTRVNTQIQCAAKVINNMQVNTDNPAVLDAFEKFKAYKFNQNKTTHEIIPVPVHDAASHASSAMMTFSLHIASKQGMVHDSGAESLSGDGTGLNSKFDPRQFGRPAPYSHDGSVSSIMRGPRGAGGAFG